MRVSFFISLFLWLVFIAGYQANPTSQQNPNLQQTKTLSKSKRFSMNLNGSRRRGASFHQGGSESDDNRPVNPAPSPPPNLPSSRSSNVGSSPQNQYSSPPRLPPSPSSSPLSQVPSGDLNSSPRLTNILSQTRKRFKCGWNFGFPRYVKEAKEKWNRFKSTVEEQSSKAVPALKRITSARSWMRTKFSDGRSDRAFIMRMIVCNTYQNVETEIVKYFIDDLPNGHQWLLTMENLQNALTKLEIKKRKIRKFDIRETAEIRANPPFETLPTEDFDWKFDCTKRCLAHYGFILEPFWPENTPPNAKLQEVLAFPLARGIIYEKKKRFFTSGNSDANNPEQNYPFVCKCETRAELFPILKDTFKIQDLTAFKGYKEESSLRTKTYLDRVFLNSDVKYIEHDLFVLAVMESASSSGEKTVPHKSFDQLLAEVHREPAEKYPEINLGEWEEKRFRNRFPIFDTLRLSNTLEHKDNED